MGILDNPEIFVTVSRPARLRQETGRISRSQHERVDGRQWRIGERGGGQILSAIFQIQSVSRNSLLDARHDVRTYTVEGNSGADSIVINHQWDTGGIVLNGGDLPAGYQTVEAAALVQPFPSPSERQLVDPGEFHDVREIEAGNGFLRFAVIKVLHNLTARSKQGAI